LMHWKHFHMLCWWTSHPWCHIHVPSSVATIAAVPSYDSPKLLLISPIAKPFDYWFLYTYPGSWKLFETTFAMSISYSTALFVSRIKSFFVAGGKDQLRISPCKDKNNRIRHLCPKKKKTMCTVAE
jgi:hypothetical protein